MTLSAGTPRRKDRNLEEKAKLLKGEEDSFHHEPTVAAQLTSNFFFLPIFHCSIIIAMKAQNDNADNSEWKKSWNNLNQLFSYPKWQKHMHMYC